MKMATTIKYAHINPYKENLLELAEGLGESNSENIEIIQTIEGVMDYVDDVQFEALVSLGKDEESDDPLKEKLSDVLKDIKKHTDGLDE